MQKNILTCMGTIRMAYTMKKIKLAMLYMITL